MGEPLCICFGMKEYCCKCFGEPVSVLGDVGSKGGKVELDSAYRGRGGLRHTEAPWHVPQNYKVGRHILKLISISFTQRMLYSMLSPTLSPATLCHEHEFITHIRKPPPHREAGVLRERKIVNETSQHISLT